MARKPNKGPKVSAALDAELFWLIRNQVEGHELDKAGARLHRMEQLLRLGANAAADHLLPDNDKVNNKFTRRLDSLQLAIEANTSDRDFVTKSFLNSAIKLMLRGDGTYPTIKPIDYFRHYNRSINIDARDKTFLAAIRNHDMETLRLLLDWVEPSQDRWQRYELINGTGGNFKQARGLLTLTLEEFPQAATLLANHPDLDVLSANQNPGEQNSYFHAAVRANNVEVIKILRRRLETNPAITPQDRQRVMKGAFFLAAKYKAQAALDYILSPDFKDPATGHSYFDPHDTRVANQRELPEYTSEHKKGHSLTPMGYAFGVGNLTLVEQLRQHPEIRRQPKLYDATIQDHFFRAYQPNTQKWQVADTFFSQLLSRPAKLEPNLGYAAPMAAAVLGVSYDEKLEKLERAYRDHVGNKGPGIPSITQPVYYLHYLHYLLKAHAAAQAMDPQHMTESARGRYISPIFLSLMQNNHNQNWTELSQQVLATPFASITDIKDPIRQMTIDLVLPELLQVLSRSQVEALGQIHLNKITDKLLPAMTTLVTRGKSLKQLIELSDKWHLYQSQIANEAREPIIVDTWRSVFNTMNVKTLPLRLTQTPDGPALVITQPHPLAGYTFTDMISPEALNRESACTNHCFNGAHYVSQAQAGKSHFISFRDPRGNRIAAMEMHLRPVREDAKAAPFQASSNYDRTLYGIGEGGAKIEVLISQYRMPARSASAPAPTSDAGIMMELFVKAVQSGEVPLVWKNLGVITPNGQSVSALEQYVGLLAPVKQHDRERTFSLYAADMPELGNWLRLRGRGDAVTYIGGPTSMDWMQTTGMRSALWEAYRDVTGNRPPGLTYDPSFMGAPATQVPQAPFYGPAPVAPGQNPNSSLPKIEPPTSLRLAPRGR